MSEQTPTTYTRSDPPKGDAQAIIDNARTAAIPDTVEADDFANGVMVYTVPSGAVVERVDLSKLAASPRQATGAYRVATLDSFLALVERHRGEDTTIWAHPTDGQVVAVINDHGKGSTPRWGDLRVTLGLQPTPEWERWKQLDGRVGSQQTFAEHIEDSIPEIVEPDGATLLEIAQSFHASTQVEFRSGQRLSDGNVKLQYDEETQASAGQRGEIAVPAEFTLALAPFIGEESEALVARLRYRVREGNLTIGYKLDRPDDVVRRVLDRIRGRLVEVFGPETVYVSPAAPAARR